MLQDNKETEVSINDVLLVMFLYMADKGMLKDLIEKYDDSKEHEP